MLHMEIMMSSQDSSPAWYNHSTDHGEATGVGDGGAEGFLEIYSDRQSSGDLFELVWGGGGGDGGGMDQVLQHHLPLSPEPPSDDEMAAWLYRIVRGDVEPVSILDQPACGDIVDGSGEEDQLVVAANEATKIEMKGTKDKVDNSSHTTKPAAGGRRSHHSETHNLTEKRRRWKINEKFKTLQELVPGCNKCNQASILDQTFQYMKSLQQQIQAMATIGYSMRPATAATYPVVQPPTYQTPAGVATGLPPPPQAAIAPGMLVRGLVPPVGVLAPPAAPMAPFLPMLPLVRHPSVMVHAAPVLQYPETVVPNAASPAGTLIARERYRSSCDV